jgi:vacuolar-type H+-ATPase subunit E/Vma4
MPLAELLVALERDGQASVDQELSRAREEASRILEAAAATAARETGDALAGHEAALRAAAERKVAEARRQAERGVLEARASFLDRVYAAALLQLPRVRDLPAYGDTMRADVEAALRYLPAGPLTIHCASADAPLVQAGVAGREAVTIVPSSEVTAGVRLVADDGAVEVDRSLTTRLAARRPALSIEILGHLEDRS